MTVLPIGACDVRVKEQISQRAACLADISFGCGLANGTSVNDTWVWVSWGCRATFWVAGTVLRCGNPNAGLSSRRQWCARTPPPPEACLPSILVTGIGSARTGTTTVEGIFRLVEQATQPRTGRSLPSPIAVAQVKCCGSELMFWNRDDLAASGVQRYCDMFPTLKPATRVSFEKTPSYAFSRNTPLNFMRWIPLAKARFIFTFREVGDLSWSLFVLHRSLGSSSGSRGSAQGDSNSRSSSGVPPPQRSWRSFGDFAAEHMGYARSLAACLGPAQSAHPLAPLTGAQSLMGPPARRNTTDELSVGDPDQLHARVCELSQLPAAQYLAFAQRTRDCKSSPLLWVANYLHWSALVGPHSRA